MGDELEDRRRARFNEAVDGVMASIMTATPITFVFPSEEYALRVSEEAARRFERMARPEAQRATG